MNKKTLIIMAAGLLQALLISAQYNGKVYSLSGQASGLDGKYIYLRTIIPPSDQQDDSVQVVHGKFRFSGKLSYPTYHVLYRKDKRRAEPLELFFGNEKVKLVVDTVDFSKSKVSGAQEQHVFRAYNQVFATYYQKPMDSLSEQEKMTDNMENKDRIRLAMKEVRKKYIAQLSSFIIQNGRSPVAAYLTYYNFSLRPEIKDLEPLYNSFSSSVKNTGYGKKILHSLQSAQRLDLGRPAPQFTLKDTAGNAVSLADFRGKYIYLDFWASWCGPCRAESPGLLAVWNKYKDEQLVFVSISGDTNREAWIKAIREDNMRWVNISDLKRHNAAMTVYHVLGIPSSYLISPDGTIIGKNLFGEELSSTLESVLSKDKPSGKAKL